MTTCWVLTRSINQYHQEGEYLEAVFAEKPSRELLKEVLKELHLGGDAFIDHILSGGGREGYEDTWYHLREQKLYK